MNIATQQKAPIQEFNNNNFGRADCLKCEDWNYYRLPDNIKAGDIFRTYCQDCEKETKHRIIHFQSNKLP